mgnify:CR=1 FL=1
MKKLYLLLVLGIGLSTWTSLSFSVEESPSTAITNVTIIDGLNGTRENQTVVFKNDLIIKIQNASETTRGLQTINGKGKFLIPGLWDFHVHLSYEDSLIEKMPACRSLFRKFSHFILTLYSRNLSPFHDW